MLLWALSSDWMPEVFFLRLVFLSGHNKSNFFLKPLKHGVNRQKSRRKSGTQQNPACPSANLLTYKHSSHFLPLSPEPLALCWRTNSAGCCTGVVTPAISILFHTAVQQHVVLGFQCSYVSVCEENTFFFPKLMFNRSACKEDLRYFFGPYIIDFDF